MLTFKSLDCLSQIDSSRPAYPVVKDLIEGMIKTNPTTAFGGGVIDLEYILSMNRWSGES